MGEKTDLLAQTAIQAHERYQRDQRFRRQAQMIVGYVLKEHGPVDRDNADREVYDIATEVASMVIERVFQNDGELLFYREMTERYRKLAEEALITSNCPPHFLTIDKPK